MTILDFGGDRTHAARLAERFGVSKTGERRTLAKLIFSMVRRQAPQEEIEVSAFAKGLRLGMSRSEVIDVAIWCAAQMHDREAA